MSPKNKYKILVTGGAGMIGSNLVKNLWMMDIMYLLQIIFGEEKRVFVFQ